MSADRPALSRNAAEYPKMCNFCLGEGGMLTTVFGRQMAVRLCDECLDDLVAFANRRPTLSERRSPDGGQP